MTTALLAASGPDDRVPVEGWLTAELRAQDRPSPANSFGDVPTVMTLLVGTRAPPQVSREIAVEIVQEQAPKPPAVAAKPVPTAAAKPPSPAAARPAPPETKPAPPPQPSAETAQLAAMQKELEALKAEQAGLKSELAVQPETPAPALSKGTGMGLAMPSISGGADGDLAGFQQLVFSQLAKAKGEGAYRGKPGVVGLRFRMDDAGKLLGVEVVRSSGDRGLDDRAVDIVRRAAPFPPPPSEADRIVLADVNFRPPTQ